MLGENRSYIWSLLQNVSDDIIRDIEIRRDEFLNFGGPCEDLARSGHLEEILETSPVTGEIRRGIITVNGHDSDGKGFEQYQTTRRSLVRIGYQRILDEVQRRDGLKLNNFIYLQHLPEEIVYDILKLVLSHPTAISVNADFSRFDLADPLDLDYRILYANRNFYRIGLPLYYGLNEFSIRLSSFIELGGFRTVGLRTAELSRIKPLNIIRRLKIVTRKGPPLDFRVAPNRMIAVESQDSKGPNLWIMMYAFRKLDKLTFDGRRWSMACEISYDGMMHDSWITIRANDELAELLRIGGVRADEQGIWVGHHTAKQADDYMTDELIPELRRTLEMLISTEQECFFVVDESRVLD